MPKPDKREIKPIFVRLSEAERRRIRTLAVSQGLTMREAIMQAFEAWASQLRSGGLTAASKRRSPSGPEISRAPAGTQSKGGRQPAYASIGQQGGRPVETLFSAGASFPAGGGSLPGLQALAEDWLRKADHFDWSKCPAAECVQTQKGKVWVAGGTLVPLVHIFEAVAGGNPLAEIVEVYDLTPQQLTTLLQFAAASAAPAASGS
jgi:uncharacterized protein (DUF433 family)